MDPKLSGMSGPLGGSESSPVRSIVSMGVGGNAGIETLERLRRGWPSSDSSKSESVS